tara:strand:- start:528 stop:734 length:207 start_codon:yes stop_codon:yes gene_type:complete
MKYIEQEMYFKETPYYVVATVSEEGSNFNANGLDVEFEAILDKEGKNLLERVEWDMYNCFETEIVENY